MLRRLARARCRRCCRTRTVGRRASSIAASTASIASRPVAPSTPSVTAEVPSTRFWSGASTTRLRRCARATLRTRAVGPVDCGGGSAGRSMGYAREHVGRGRGRKTPSASRLFAGGARAILAADVELAPATLLVVAAVRRSSSSPRSASSDAGLRPRRRRGQRASAAAGRRGGEGRRRRRSRPPARSVSVHYTGHAHRRHQVRQLARTAGSPSSSRWARAWSSRAGTRASRG